MFLLANKNDIIKTSEKINSILLHTTYCWEWGGRLLKILKPLPDLMYGEELDPE